MSRKQIVLIIILGICSFGAYAQFQPQVIEDNGIKVTFEAEHVDKSKPEGVFNIEDLVKFRFKVSDAFTGTGLSGVYPGAWVDPKPGIEGYKSTCEEQISSFISGSILWRAELDLNVFHVLALNEKASITVVDPLFGYGGSKLLTIIKLNAPGADWKKNSENNRLFVSMPAANQVAVVSTDNWSVVKNIDVPGRPVRLEIQPDEKLLWVTYEYTDNDKAGGVVAIDMESHEVVKSFVTGKGVHDLCMTGDGQQVFVTNSLDGTVTVINTDKLEEEASLKVGQHPLFMDYSKASEAVYITDQYTGKVSVVQTGKRPVFNQVEVGEGIARIRFSPNGRWGFIVNPVHDMLYIMDAATNEIVQSGDVGKFPDMVSFSDELAYIFHKEDATVLMVSLAVVGEKGAPLQVVDFPGGQNPPREGIVSSVADIMMQVPGGNAVVFSNAKDKNIYFYKEGMAASMGQFSNYDNTPQSVMVIDRSMREVEPGVYETVSKIRSTGMHTVALFMNAPRFTHCFDFFVQPNSEYDKQQLIKQMGSVKVDYLMDSTEVPVNTKVPLTFELKDMVSREALPGLKDVQVMNMQPTGLAQPLAYAKESDKPGVYAFDLVFPRPGYYYVYVGVESKDFSLSNPQYLVVKATRTKSDE